jgi:hypothetical protein
MVTLCFFERNLLLWGQSFPFILKEDFLRLQYLTKQSPSYKKMMFKIKVQQHRPSFLQRRVFLLDVYRLSTQTANE